MPKRPGTHNPLRGLPGKLERRLPDVRSEQATERRRVYFRRSWKGVRDEYLRTHPLCEDHLEAVMQRLVPATEVHHIVKIAAGGDVFDARNLRALCHSCHSIRTARGE